MFEATEAVHFVSETLTTEQGGQLLTFSGSVRGWQGERNLAAETMTLNQAQHTLHAEGRVSTRVPREQGSASVAEADFVLIESERLDYADSQGVAVYEDDVRLRFAEGWVDADRVEIWLGETTQRIHEVRSFGQVRLEITQTGSTELTGPTTGQADRLVYLPDGGTIRLFGDKAPAVLERTAEGVSTSGRVLRYNLDLGTFEVDSGDQGPASIRTSQN
jgi:lipopolysaccharide transport protein LptA